MAQKSLWRIPPEGLSETGPRPVRYKELGLRYRVGKGSWDYSLNNGKTVGKGFLINNHPVSVR